MCFTSVYSTVCLITRLWDGQTRNRGSIPGGDTRFEYPSKCPASYAVGTGRSFPKAKRPGRDADPH